MKLGRIQLWEVPHPSICKDAGPPKDEICQVSSKSHHSFKSYDKSSHQPQECQEMTQIIVEEWSLVNSFSLSLNSNKVESSQSVSQKSGLFTLSMSQFELLIMRVAFNLLRIYCGFERFIRAISEKMTNFSFLIIKLS